MLSPMFANVYLNKLEMELEKRGHCSFDMPPMSRVNELVKEFLRALQNS